jgi:two-component system cell cycle sensor histidine kinase/response regulator CckA
MDGKENRDHDRAIYDAAASEIAAQVAHDFNNLLTPLVAYPDLINVDLPEGCRGRTLMAAVEEAAQNMVLITQQLLMFSKRTGCSAQDVDINEIVRDAVARQRAMVDDERHIEFQVALVDGALEARGDAERLLQLLMNLCQNAVEAVGDGGKIQVGSQVISLSEVEASNMQLEAGRYARISVVDDGPGVGLDLQARIFEPFFTTKRSSERGGLGLGLSVAMGTAQDHGGSVIYRDTGSGSEFSAYLLLEQGVSSLSDSDASADGEAGYDVASPTIIPGSQPELLHEDTVSGDDGGILVVDDEEGIRRLFHTILGSAFPDISIGLAGNGAEAVEAVTDTSYAVVLMDLRMPVMDGMTAFSEMSAICKSSGRKMPSVVFCTGFAPPSAVREIVEGDDYHCLLTKPVSGEDLVSAVREPLHHGA